MGKLLLHSIIAGIRAVIKTATVLTVMLVSDASAFADADGNGYVPTVREDRVWCYSGWDTSDWHGDMHEIPYHVNHYIHFDGTLQIGDRSYRRGVLFKTVRYTCSFSDGVVCTFCDERERKDVLYYLREEGEKVFQLRKNGRVVTGGIENPDPSEFSETVIYDWSLNDWDEWHHWDDLEDGYGGGPVDWLARYLDDMEIDGETCRVMYMDPFSQHFQFIEGIGCMSNGSVGYYYLTQMTDYYPDNANYPGMSSHLQCVYNGDGELIYGEEVKLANAVNNIITDDTDDADTVEAPVYDLMGRRVTNLLPGSVYIRNGRKFIDK